ncbi:manganese efflux pump MntP [Clostridium sp.]|uniref:manganese efflux pump MntP n=1 Tax=Clostridium sp. TaxID=1506 RepID=UPI002FCB6974
MAFLTALIFSISSNLDNLVIGISYGSEELKIPFSSNLIIAIVSTTGTFLSMSLGNYITNFLPNYISNLIGAVVISLIGLYFIMQSITDDLKNKNSKTKVEVFKNGYCTTISSKDTFFLALSLTFNNLGTGIAASVTGISIYLVTLLTFIFSILTILIGQSLGDHVLGKFLGKYASFISGLLLFILGIIEILN